MGRGGWLVALAVLCTACGGGINSYDDAMAAQIEVMKDLVEVLEGVTDEASAQAATPKVEALGERLAEIATRVRELPSPPMSEIQELAEKYRPQMSEFQGKAAAQLLKLAQYPELMQAYTRAVANLG